ncbi:MAG: glyoxalase superfamily protein [Parcubacteria group bacterium]|jgi:predicted enzyme related to lactoylglutathione lyase
MKLDSAVFYSNDIEKATEFYRDVIGLEVDYIQEGKYSSFNFENAKFGIKQRKEEREVPGSQTIFVEAKNIEDLYSLLKEKGVSFYKEIVEEDWGTNFSLLDPDGNKIQFVRRRDVFKN